MGRSRKDALHAIQGTVERIEDHLRKISDDPTNTAANHWRYETMNWIDRVEKLTKNAGKKTAKEWAQWIEEKRSQLARNHLGVSATDETSGKGI